MRIEHLWREWDVEVRFVHFPLHPETPPEGLTLEQLFAGRNIGITAAQARMKQLMDDEGLPYGERTMTYNSRLAQELACYAQTQPGGERIHEQLFQAYFVNRVNIAAVAALVEIGTRVGLEAEACRDVLASRRFRDDVDGDWNRSRALGIRGVPTFVVGQNMVVGAQPREVLDELLEHAGAKRRGSMHAGDESPCE